jgi:hypothetical protein
MGTIRSSWIALSPTHRFDARYWLAVRKQMSDNNIDPDNAKLDEVKAAIKVVEKKGVARVLDPKSKRG